MVWGDFLSALIVELINYRFTQNDKKPVWLKIDWIHEKLPYITRSGLAKKLGKLMKGGHIIVKRGEGRHYHKLWFSPSTSMREACAGKSVGSGKVYYNPDVAEQHLEASVVYAAIVNLLRREGLELDGVDNNLTLDYAKLAEGSGLSISKVRKAVKWLIENRKIDAKNIFGNKRQVWVPTTSAAEPADEGYSFQRVSSLPLGQDLWNWLGTGPTPTSGGTSAMGISSGASLFSPLSGTSSDQTSSTGK